MAEPQAYASPQTQEAAGGLEPRGGLPGSICVRFPVYRACLSTIYSCGLRLSEGAFLKVKDIDSSRMMVRVLGKGSGEPRERKKATQKMCPMTRVQPGR